MAATPAQVPSVHQSADHALATKAGPVEDTTHAVRNTNLEGLNAENDGTIAGLASDDADFSKDPDAEAEKQSTVSLVCTNTEQKNTNTNTSSVTTKQSLNLIMTGPLDEQVSCVSAVPPTSKPMAISTSPHRAPFAPAGHTAAQLPSAQATAVVKKVRFVTEQENRAVAADAGQEPTALRRPLKRKYALYSELPSAQTASASRPLEKKRRLAMENDKSEKGSGIGHGSEPLEIVSQEPRSAIMTPTQPQVNVAASSSGEQQPHSATMTSTQPQVTVDAGSSWEQRPTQIGRARGPLKREGAFYWGS